MKVTIAGGHGKVAMHLTRLLTSQGHSVVSLVRNPLHEPEVAELGAQPIRVDLEADPVPQIVASLPEGSEAVVFAAGAGPGSGAERKRTVDHEGAAKMIEVAREQSIPRYLIVSSVGADADHPGEEVFDVYLRAKGAADRDLAASGLDYTIVRPGPLSDEPGTGRVETGVDLPRREVPREDVAAVLAACLTLDRGSRTTFEVVGGDTPIPDAVASIG